MFRHSLILIVAISLVEAILKSILHFWFCFVNFRHVLVSNLDGKAEHVSRDSFARMLTVLTFCIS